LEWLKPSKVARDPKQAPAVPISEIATAETPRIDENIDLPNPIVEILEIDLETYVPNVSKETREWFVSETDLDFISEGCGILGTGGGGSVYSALLHSRQVLRACGKRSMRIIEAGTLAPDSNTIPIAFAGAPSVSNERLIAGDEMQRASQHLSKFLNIPSYDAIMAAEIGGSNGMRTFAAAASMSIPIVDADMMGRAFPKLDMALPYVYGQASPAPAVLSDARGNIQIIAGVEDSHRFETLVRSASIELGLYAALSLAPLTRDVVQRFCCTGSLSFAWSMGREVCLARRRNQSVVQALVSCIVAAKSLF
jgi:DUF917 family protein